MKHNHFIQNLPSGALDIVGDVHGEWAVLQQLLRHLGYDERGEHPQGRRLVFIGDIVDRGPDSPAALAWVMRAREQHGVLGVLGNHELNILAGDPKDGSAWFFDSRMPEDTQYLPYQRLPIDERSGVLADLQTWPLVLQREDLRLVHAAWLPESINAIHGLDPERNIAQWYNYFDKHVHELVEHQPWYPQYQQEYKQYDALLGQEDLHPPMLSGHTEFELSRWKQNPVRALVSGSEEPVSEPFYAGARWRFTGRSAWWERYHDDVPVVMGHYWRLWQSHTASKSRHAGLMPADGSAWFGAKNNVFCIDFSIGARWRDRQQNLAPAQSKFHLAALRWPERTIVMDNGAQYASTAFEAA